MNNLYIPGLMPPACQAPPPLLADPLGGINAVLFKTIDTKPKSSFSLIAETIEGKTLFTDPEGERVFFRPAAAGGEYRLITNPEHDILPVGTSVLRVMADRKEETKFFLSVTSGAFQKLNSRPYVPPGFTLTGQLGLAEGDTVVGVEFCPVFQHAPAVALAQVLTDRTAPAPLAIDAHILDLFGTRMVLELSQAPNTGGYRLVWAAWF